MNENIVNCFSSSILSWDFLTCVVDKYIHVPDTEGVNFKVKLQASVLNAYLNCVKVP